ncbi:MAG: DUF1080 domain-containing protein [Saprospiraceae bacterium]
MKPVLIFILAVALASCNNAKNTTATAESDNPPDSIRSAEPVSLFDGQSFKGWHGFNKTGEIKNWAIEDGALVCLGAAADAHGGDIVTDAEYENFELNWEWKVTPGANSGVMYHVIEDPKYQAPYETGPEYQVIDDVGFPEKLEDWQKAAADYAMYTPNEKKQLKPVGEWNSSKIVFNRGQVEHWLNGEKVIEFTAWNDEWTKLKTEGKWKDYPDYGSAKKGRIALQDHGNKVYFRSITIREL